MTEPLRHQAGERNRRKMLHHAKCAREELAFLRDELRRLDDKFRYALGRVDRLINRLKSEVEHKNARPPAGADDRA